MSPRPRMPRRNSEGKRDYRRGCAFVLPYAMIAFILLAGQGCGGADPVRVLDRSRKACETYASGGGYLKFREEVLLELDIGGREVVQRIEVDGEQIFPERQRYRRVESWSAPEDGGAEESVDLLYLTVDGGKTVYVRGSKVESLLGTAAWVCYEAPSGEDYHFDLLRTIKLLTENQADLSVERREKRLFLRYRADVEEILRSRIQEAGEEWKEEWSGVLGEGLGRDLSVEMVVDEKSYLPLEMRAEKEVRREGLRAFTRLAWWFSGYGEDPPSGIEPPGFYVKAG